MKRVPPTFTGNPRGCRSRLRRLEDIEWPKVEVVAEALVKPRNRLVPFKFFVLASTTFLVGDLDLLTLSEVHAEVLLSGWRCGRPWMVLSCLRQASRAVARQSASRLTKRHSHFGLVDCSARRFAG